MASLEVSRGEPADSVYTEREGTPLLCAYGWVPEPESKEHRLATVAATTMDTAIYQLEAAVRASLQSVASPAASGHRR
eukprot:8690697-Pyramimonas_sp.AAC.3